jgi:hypothetical protein
VLKDSFALLSAPSYRAENAVVVVFSPCFGPLLDRRCAHTYFFNTLPVNAKFAEFTFLALRCIRTEGGFVPSPANCDPLNEQLASVLASDGS